MNLCEVVEDYGLVNFTTLNIQVNYPYSLVAFWPATSIVLAFNTSTKVLPSRAISA